jgi:uncharacterized damage-inducible protein DinB
MLEELIHTFEVTVRFMQQSVADLSEEQMVQQPSGVPNHATWTLGHMIYSCQGMATELGADPWLPDNWESVFGYGSTPRPDGQQYPEKAQLQELLAEATARLSETLRSVEASVLSRPLPNDDFPTMSHLVVQVVIAHTAYHAGQLSVWRRALGKEPVAVFV